MIIYFVPKNLTWNDLISSLDEDPFPSPCLSRSIFSHFRFLFPGRILSSYYDLIVPDHIVLSIYKSIGGLVVRT